MKKGIFYNYKTTTPALCAIAIIVVYYLGYITTEQVTISVTLLTSVGLLGSKDHDKL